MGRRAPCAPGRLPPPGGGCARSGCGSTRRAPPPAWQGAVAPARWTIVGSARLALESRPPRPSAVAAPCVGPRSHSTNDGPVNRGYDQVVKSAARLFLATATLAAFVPAVQARAADAHVLVATLNGVINPITDSYVSKAVDRAVGGQANALIIQMDTPGGLDTSMRDIIKKILAAPV